MLLFVDEDTGVQSGAESPRAYGVSGKAGLAAGADALLALLQAALTH